MGHTWTSYHGAPAEGADACAAADRGVLRCTNHSTGFRADAGEGVEGLGRGGALDPVRVRISGNGRVVIG